MNVLIVGCGKVGSAVAAQLLQEQHLVTIVDTDQARLDDVVNTLDVQGVVGSGSSYDTLMEAGVADADLFIAVTSQDETNMLACLLARKLGHCQTIARVRNPEYHRDIQYIKDELGLAMVVNPEREAAMDIFRLLQTPAALEIDNFHRGRVSMIRLLVNEGSPLAGKNMIEINSLVGGKMLVCIRERNGEIVIPNGNTDLQAGDKISVVIPLTEVSQVLHSLKLQQKPIHSAMIAGGGTMAVYLADSMIRARMHVTIVESDLNRCNQLAELLPRAQIIHGDTTDKQVLREEGLLNAEAFICLTNLDEENIMLALYADKVSNARVVTKISRIEFEEVIDTLPLGAVIYPKNIMSERIVRHVRAMENAAGNNAETLYQMLDGRVEAMEFVVSSAAKKLTGIPLKSMMLKQGLLLCCINRDGKVISPSGNDMLQENDVVVIVTTHKGIRDLRDIVR